MQISFARCGGRLPGGGPARVGKLENRMVGVGTRRVLALAEHQNVTSRRISKQILWVLIKKKKVSNVLREVKKNSCKNICEISWLRECSTNL